MSLGIEINSLWPEASYKSVLHSFYLILYMVLCVEIDYVLIFVGGLFVFFVLNFKKVKNQARSKIIP